MTKRYQYYVHRTLSTPPNWRIALLAIVLGVTMVMETGATDFRVLVMLPYQKPGGFKFAFGAELSGAAVQLAVKDIEQQNLLPGHRLLLDYGNSHCNVVKGLGTAADMLYSKRYSIIIGPQCSQACSHVGRLAAHLNIADFTGVCQDTEMLNKIQFKTLTRFLGSFTMVGEAVMSFFSHHNWTTFSVISEMHVDKIWILTKGGIQAVASSTGKVVAISLVYGGTGNEHKTISNLTAILRTVAARSRIIVVAVRGDTLRQLMLCADDMNLLDGRFVFIVVFYYRQEKVFGDFSWKRGDADDERARRAYQHLIFVTYYTRQSIQYDEFVSRMRIESARLFNHTYSDTDAIPYPAANLYEAMYMYAVALNETLTEGGDVTSGTNVSQRLWNRQFKSITGHLKLNSNGDREQGYTFSQLASVHGGSDTFFSLQEVGNFFSDKGVYYPSVVNKIIWYNKVMPSDTPQCGFHNEFCLPMSRETILIISIGTIIGTMALVFVLLFVGFIYYKRFMKKKHTEVIWRIDPDDVVLGTPSGVSKSKLSLITDSKENIYQSDSAFTKTGTYKGTIVAIKTFQYISDCESQVFKREYYEMTQLNCSNVTKIIGLSIGPQCLVLSEYCGKGSLQDLLENCSINLDLTFKYSLITDMIKGLTYLHDSPINYHGNLKSSNCVIDGRFILKLTDFGPKQWLKNNCHMSKDKLWTAPEVLRMKMPDLPQNWRIADIYSLAIIMQEIAERNGVFFLVDMELDPEETVQRVLNESHPCFRPSLNKSITPVLLVHLVEECWHDVPALRPNLRVIRDRMNEIRGPGNKNFMDNLLNRMEQYANNLETLVEERTWKYLHEKKRVEQLLYSILPRPIADQLQVQGFVDPESYDSVTLLFTDIKGFTKLSAKSNPIQIVNMLNDLYTTFDAIIDKYDAYKVETIGDAYMVVSGLPRQNDDHFCQIADLTLELMKSVMSFLIQHMPSEKLLLRAGVHSGACVAGVVGLKMPRYCLFGDTVNTASRMESTSDAMMIHISETTRDRLVASGRPYRLEKRGTIQVKGKGHMTTYWLYGKENTPKDFTCEETPHVNQNGTIPSRANDVYIT